ncbi:D-ribose pyranase [uncultured Fusobacterium sp.]|uniref:D-ribose pyranase n=1 Tax=uncultured Fusobacterium sp. TaxID=159267 RepID=UPI002804ABEC|nr:D-ribose pyranase [uncultured Fusobacterium sp.]
MKKVVVVGSINMDLVTMCQRVPKAGETIFGDRFFQVPGGKGANQGVAMGKLGTKVTMLGKVGEDSFGNDLINSMKNSGVNTDYIERSEKSTGIAKIIVEANGQNRILVVSGANMDVDKDYIDRHIDVIKNADIVVTQLELPLPTVEYVLGKAKEFDKLTILNPAPAEPFPKDVKRIDLALEAGTPTLIQVLKPILSEMQVEEIILAREIHDHNIPVYAAIMKAFKEAGMDPKITEVSYEDFKKITHESEVIVRSGECSPYANIILKSGVIF